MRRTLEFTFYAVFILFFILRYAGEEEGSPRRPDLVPKSPERSVLLPEGATLPRDISSSVVVEIESKNQASVGTAFAVDDTGTFVSARHVIEGCESISLVRGRRILPARLQSKARNRDFAILHVEGVRVQPFELALNTPVRGEKGYMMGYPQGRPADVRATVIGETIMKSRGRYSTRERVVAWVERERRPGFGGSLGGISGGPVFSAAGKVIGTVVAGAPRRGRVYTTNPAIFEETGLFVENQSVTPPDTLTDENYDQQADKYRAALRVAQVYCSVQ